MQQTKNFFIPAFLVFFLSLALSDLPVASYLVAWLGSFVVFYLSWFAKQRIILSDRPIISQIMRPLFLLQLIFAGFMCSTSIFYFLDHLGYDFFEKTTLSNFIVNEQTYLIAKCQRLSLLGHIALVWGILWQQNKKQHHYSFTFITSSEKLNYQWLKLAIGFYLMATVFQFIGGLFQFSIYFSNMAIFCASLLLLKGLRSKNIIFIIYGAGIFGLNFINATLTGYKEHILTNAIILFALLFPYYKRLITALSIPCIYILLYILPTYANVIREQSWSGEKTAQEARNSAFETLLNEDSEEKIAETNWGFLTNRLSEIGMFTQYVAFVPEKRDYYGFQILEDSFLALLPRALYPSKPITEMVAMERVYEVGIVERGAMVSAKTRPVVDAYLSFGYIGVFLFLFVLGLLAQFFNNIAERWFGGYEFGCIVVFNGCFQVLWRGNNFEFMLNNIFYGFVTMWLVFIVLKKMQILVPTKSKQNITNLSTLKNITTTYT